MKSTLKILHLEANPADAELIERELKKGDTQFEVLVVTSKTAFTKALKSFVPDIILADHTLQSFDCKDALKMIRQSGLTIPFILVTDAVSEEYAVEVMKAGADDYILKDRLYRLPQALLKTKEKYRAESNLQTIFENISEGFIFLDQYGIVKSFNTKAAKTIFLNTEQEIKIGSTIYDFIHPSRREAYKGVILKICEGESIQYDHSFERKNGETKWFNFSLNPAYAISGNLEGISITSTDITERKIAENKLSKTSEELQKTLSELTIILDSSLDVICTINKNGEFLTVSAASQQAWGYSPKELIGTKFISLVCEEDIEMSNKATNQIINGIIVPLFENRFVHKDGSLVSFLWSVNWDEKLQLMFCIAKNVTEKRRLENAIQSERDQFYQILLKAPVAIGILIGPDHIFLMANPLFLTLFGKENVIGKKAVEVNPEFIEQGLIAILDKVYKTGESFIGKEMQIKFDKNGNGELIDLYLNFIYQTNKNDAGEIEGIFIFINDVSEQVILRKKIEKSEKFFKGVIENSDDMITMYDITGKTIYASPAVSKKFGYTNEEILNLKVMDVINPDDIPRMANIMDELLRHPTVPIPCPIIREKKKDGSHIWVDGTLTNFLETEGINAIIANFRDITERKIADEQNQFKANLLNTIGQAAVATDINGVVNYWNKAAEDIYGWSKEEALGRNILDITPSEKTIDQATQIMGELKKGKSWAGEFIAMKKDGSSFPALITNAPIYDENNTFTGIIGISSDNGEKRKLEALLDKSNRLARIGSWEIDIANGHVYWSDITKEIREVEHDFIPKLSIGISYFTEGINRDTITQRLQECIEYGIPWDEELQITTFKGNLIWVRTIGQGEFFQGKCVRVYGSIQDITERKNAADKIVRSEVKLNTAQHIAHVGSWEVALFSQEQSWSDEFYNILGINKNVQASDEVFLSFVHPEDREFAAASMQEGYSNLKDSSFHFRFIRNNGETGFALSEWKFEYDQLNNPIYIIGILRDLTKEKLAESVRLKMISDLVQRNSDLEQFSYIVSHNLRAPAANIIGFAEILQEESITQEERIEVLDRLSSSVSSLDSTIKDINSILQINREIHDKKEVIFFSKLVTDIKASLRNLIDRHEVQILTDFSEVDEIYSLKVYIYSIFFNLISNSIKYSKPNENPLIEIRSRKENAKIFITFKDNGLGINLKTKGDKVFGLYNRFHSHVEGKGMGLFMVKTQVGSLGGKISIKSEVNEGTEFTVEFEF